MTYTPPVFNTKTPVHAGTRAKNAHAVPPSFLLRRHFFRGLVSAASRIFNGNDTVFLTRWRFQIEAPEGFWACASDPAHTFPGLADKLQAYSFPSSLLIDWIIHISGAESKALISHVVPHDFAKISDIRHADQLQGLDWRRISTGALKKNVRAQSLRPYGVFFKYQRSSSLLL